jgi:hypothetical protein
MITILGGEIDLLVRYPNGQEDTLVLPSGYGIAFDPDGRQLDGCSLFLGPVMIERASARGGVDCIPEFARDWFGSGYEPRKAVIDVPDGRWKSIGRAREIIYYRPGKYESDWVHEFEKPVALFKQADWYWLKFPTTCRVTWRGIESP